MGAAQGVFQVYRTSFNKDTKVFGWLCHWSPSVLGIRNTPKSSPDPWWTGVSRECRTLKESVCFKQSARQTCQLFPNTNPTSRPSQNSNLLAVRKQLERLYRALSFKSIHTNTICVYNQVQHQELFHRQTEELNNSSSSDYTEIREAVGGHHSFKHSSL